MMDPEEDGPVKKKPSGLRRRRQASNLTAGGHKKRFAKDYFKDTDEDDEEDYFDEVEEREAYANYKKKGGKLKKIELG